MSCLFGRVNYNVNIIIIAIEIRGSMSSPLDHYLKFPPSILTLYSIACSLSIDVGLVLDSSARVGRWGFRQIKRFARLIARSFTISQKYGRVGVIVYGSYPRVEFGLNRYFNARYVDRTIERLRFIGGLRRTGKALEMALSGLFRGSRKKRVLVFVTNGPAADGIRLPSLRIHQSGIETFAIGIGSRSSHRELSAIATNARHTYMVTFRTLKSIVKSIVRKACKGNSLKPCMILQIEGNITSCSTARGFG